MHLATVFKTSKFGLSIYSQRGPKVGWLTSSHIVSSHFRVLCDVPATVVWFLEVKLNRNWKRNWRQHLVCDQEWAAEAVLVRRRGPWRPSSDSRHRPLWNKGYEDNNTTLTCADTDGCGCSCLNPPQYPMQFDVTYTDMMHFHVLITFSISECYWCFYNGEI